EVDKPEVDQPATDKPGWLPDISVPSKPEVDKPEINKPEIEKPEVSSQTAYENKVLELVNVERSKQGLKPLQMDESVRNVARVKSSDMRKNNYFDHNSPVYGSPFDMLKQFGISYRSAGENIAQGYSSPEAVVEGWMNSPGHRANILNSSFTHIGVGYDAQGHYWTQMFIGK
ncbi:MAG: CAP domain-containing protein, partial [Niameybacter sp.]